jgi:microsomal dipeptidase-like Zn-dependent dipeptidase
VEKLVSALGGSLPRIVDRYVNCVKGDDEYDTLDENVALHRQLGVVDLHSDALLLGRNLLEKSKSGHVDIPRLIEGNVAVQGFGVVTKVPLSVLTHPAPAQNVSAYDPDMISLLPEYAFRGLLERALLQADRLKSFVEPSEGRFRILESREDLQEYLDDRKRNPKITAGILCLEGAHALEGRVDSVDRLADVGFRMIGLAHFFDNEIGGSAHGEERYGLTDLGEEVVKRMRARHLILDLAHASGDLIDDVVKINDTERPPLVVSHTGVDGTHQSIRNLSDAQIEQIVDKGGLIGIGFFKAAVGNGKVKKIAEAIRHVARLPDAGANSVCLGSDFDGFVSTPFDAAGMAKVTDILRKIPAESDEGRGVEDHVIPRIMGENALDMLKEALPSRVDQ